MEHEIIFDADFCKITYEPHINLLIVKWLRHPTNEEHKEVFLKGLEAIKKYNIVKLITDMRKIGIVAQANKAWLTKDIIPQAKEYGIKCVAVILDHDTFKKHYLDQLATSFNEHEIHFKTFDDNTSEAIDWILKK